MRIIVIIILNILFIFTQLIAKNIASQSNLYYELVDGKKGCACVNKASFGPGWNPGEVIEADFPNKVTISGVGLYLGCSVQHGEYGTGYIEAKLDDGSYMKIASFEKYGYVTNKFKINFPYKVTTDSLRFHLISGGGPDSNLCLSEIEIYDSDNEEACDSSNLDKKYNEGYNAGYEAGKKFCQQNPSACGISVSSSTDCSLEYQNGYNKGYEEGKNSCGGSSTNPFIPVSQSECYSTYNVFTNTLKIPCFSMENKMYDIEMTLETTKPIRFILKSVKEKGK